MTFVRLALMAAGYAFGAFTVAWFAASVAMAGLATGPALALKGALVTAVLVVVTVLGARELRAPSVRDVVLLMTASLAGFLADPFTWAGRTFVGQAVAEAGVTTVVADLLLWLVVTAVTAAIVLRRVRSGETIRYAA